MSLGPGSLWRHYSDQATLDRQFTLDGVADPDALRAHRHALSSRARAETPCRLGLRYGHGPAATLDLFLPQEGASAAPVLLFIHGGFWKSLDAATFSFVGGAYARAGALVTVIDYPLIPSVRMPDIVDHVGQALRWLRAHAADHGGDPDRLHISGHSAGGHLTALAMDPAWLTRQGVPPAAVRGGVAISGLYELEPVRRSFMQEELAFTDEEVTRWSPLRRLPRAGAPLLVAVAGAETQEFIDQSIEYVEAWRTVGNHAHLQVVAGANHLSILTDAFAAPGAPLFRATLAQMGLSGT